jgi:hypothetical protein
MRIRDLFRRPSRHPQPHTRRGRAPHPPRLEHLEDRTAPAILFGDHPGLTVSDNGGPVLANAQVRLIFWGTGWDSGIGPMLRTQVENAINALDSSTYFYSPLPGADLSQYRPGAQSRPTVVASLRTNYLSPGTTFTTDDVWHMLQHEYGMTPQYYYVIPDPDSALAGGGTDYHTYWSQGSSREYFGYSRNLAIPSREELTTLYSRVMVGSITDPDGTALQVNPRNPTSWNEIGLGEAEHYTYRVNGVLAQSYWSQADGKFTVPTGQTQNFLVSSSGVLTVNGDQLANPNDTITLDVSGGGVRATLNGEVAQFDPGRISSVVVNAGAGHDSVTVANTLSGVPVTVNTGNGGSTVTVLRNSSPVTVHGGGGLDTVTIGNAGSLAGILAGIDVSNPPAGGYTALTVDTSAYASAYTATLSDTSVSFGGPAITYRPGDLRSLTLLGGSGNDTYRILNTPASGYAGNVVTTINAGSGDDLFYVLGTAAGTTTALNGGDGYDGFILGGDGTGSLAGIAGRVLLDGQGGGGYVWANDAGGVTGRTFTLTGDTLSWGSATVQAATVYTFEVTGAAADNVFRVQSTGGSFTWSLDDFGGNNTLIGPNTPTTWGLVAGASYSSVGANVVFRTDLIQNLTAGAGDHITFGDGAAIAGNLTGGGGVTLDYSAYTTSVVVDLQTGLATGVGGTVSGIGTVIGGSGAPASGGVYNLLIGNGGNVLQGGTGRRNILVAGGSASTLTGGDGEDLLVAGTTAYDTEPGLASWQAIAAYWAGPDDYATRVGNLTSGAGVPLLDATTVTGNGGGNTLTGSGARALIYTDGLDNITGFDPSSQQVAITP